MAVITTRPLSPRQGEPFTGYLITVNAGQERSAVEIEQGKPKVEPVELIPGRYSLEWIEAGKEPVMDVAIVPDEPEVELSNICNSLKGESVEESGEQSSGFTVATDATVGNQPPGAEQEVAGQNVTSKRKGAAPADG